MGVGFVEKKKKRKGTLRMVSRDGQCVKHSIQLIPCDIYEPHIAI